ncbi:unnamed protein product [Allacma fusca]|uniref:Plexin domain-containing protein 2 n=1 Tax=Allacma fusca TaxID=39272 RepID=A0A8J2K0N0_9HEXA|nr:unnamed protein product [Allacma fusca]
MYNFSLGVTLLFLIGATNHIILGSSAESAQFQSGSYLVSSETGPQRVSDFSNNGWTISEFIPLARTKRQLQQSNPTLKPVEPTKSEENSSSVAATTPVPVTVPVATASTTVVNSSVTHPPSPSVVITVPNTTVAHNVPSFNKTEQSFDDELDKNFPNYFDFSAKAPKNSTLQPRNETHKYYNISYVPNGAVYWVDLESHPDAIDHDMLSSAHRRAATLKLKFNFPFYGHLVDNATIATGGFVYLGEQVHAWLAATQYVAPLMANFDSSLSENATVRYLSTSDQFSIEWNKVHLKDTPDKGSFTFQASLYKNGTIVFAYKSIPIDILNISDSSHPVKVGLSDAFIRDKNVLLFKQKTIYEYDRVEIRSSNKDIVNGTAVIFTPLPTCLSYKSCYKCSHHETSFECVWCHSAGRCSDGTDRYRQDWLTKGCESDNATQVEHCDVVNTSTYTIESTTGKERHASPKGHPDDHVNVSPIAQHHEEGMGAAGVIGILFLVMMIVTGAGWVFYAYLFPHSTSGQLLIRYRPSQWTFRRGEARYTAASIHM